MIAADQQVRIGSPKELVVALQPEQEVLAAPAPTFTWLARPSPAPRGRNRPPPPEVAAGEARFPLVTTVLQLALLAAGLALVVGGAEAFLDGVVGAARRFGVSAFVLTVVISGFELENLAAGIAANAKGLPGAAAGTFLGGTTFLALGVAGVGGLIAPIDAVINRRLLVWTAVAPLPLLALALDGRLSRLDGAVLVAWFVFALAGAARGQPPVPDDADRADHADDADAHARVPRHAVLRLVGGLVLLGVGGELLGEGIRRVVRRFGVSESLLGNTVVAASVEAEELGRVVVPARRGRGELAVANIVGTIIHFVGLNAGLIALVRPLALDTTTRALHLPVAVASTAVLCVVLGVRRRVDRPTGAALASLYLAYLVVAVAVGR